VHKRQHPSCSKCFIIAVSLAFAVVLGLAGPGYSGLTIHCIDVGQGDCTLIVSPTGGTFLFDAGDNGRGNSVVIPYLQSLGFTGLDYISCSHYHADHIGGIDEVVNWMGIDSVRVAVLDRGWSYTTKTYQSYAAAVAAKRTTMTDGAVIDLGGGVTVTCLGLNGNGILSPPFDDQEENDMCIALLVEYADFDFFVAGDLSGVNSSYYHDIETSISAEAGDVDVYRVDHHGSASNTNSNLVSNLSPEVSIISCGNNSYGHPTQTVINRLVSADSYIYQTELGDGGTIPYGDGEVVGGHIVIEVNSTAYTINSDKSYPLESSGVEIAEQTLPFRAYPNPFASSTTVSFSLPVGEKADIGIYDVTGRLVRLFPGIEASGEVETVLWDGSSIDGRETASGLYFVRISSPLGGATRKVVKK
jgi:beta-lactamase superfamily II metal-dependent hydrolase